MLFFSVQLDLRKTTRNCTLKIYIIPIHIFNTVKIIDCLQYKHWYSKLYVVYVTKSTTKNIYYFTFTWAKKLFLRGKNRKVINVVTLESLTPARAEI